MITTLRGILAAIHRTLTARATGFSEYEASDYLTSERRDDNYDFEPSNKPWDNFPWLQRGDTVAVQLADGTIWTGPFDPDSVSGIAPNTIQRHHPRVMTGIFDDRATLWATLHEPARVAQAADEASAAPGDGAADRPAPDAPTPQVPGAGHPTSWLLNKAAHLLQAHPADPGFAAELRGRATQFEAIQD